MQVDFHTVLWDESVIYTRQISEISPEHQSRGKSGPAITQVRLVKRMESGLRYSLPGLNVWSCVKRSERSCVAPPALWSLDSFLVPRCREIVEGLLWVTGIRKCGGCTSGLKDRTPTQSMANSEISNSGVEKRGSKRLSRGVRLFSLDKIPISLCLLVGQRHGQHGMMSVVRCGIDRPTLSG